MLADKFKITISQSQISERRFEGSCWLAVCFFNFCFLIFNSPSPAQLVKAVDAVGMTVADMDRSIDFFNKVLSFDKISDVELHGSDYEKLQGLFGLRMRVVRMKLGTETIELTQYLAPEGRPIPPDWRSNDHAFQHIAIVVSDMDKAYQHLRSHKIRHASTGPQTIPATNKAAAGIRAFYFKDPDGHHLEIIYFPQGKGDPRWQQKNDRLFLGIDHTAIVVSSTANSLKYYRDLLGLKLAGESMNYGVEQEHLNNVAGARLHISGLRALSGPGIEFLEYLTPRDGRPAPRDTRANDIWHWQTTLTTDNALGAWHKHPSLSRSAATRNPKRETRNALLASPGVAEIKEKQLGFVRGFLARDPDGHGLQFVER
ncbi:MAG: VOC family protein [Deltaproteobacteria bacterium]|nr:VOC family protein [Deltaproteobacteria bacterium]